MFWILGVLVLLFLGAEAWVLCRASANREAAAQRIRTGAYAVDEEGRPL